MSDIYSMSRSSIKSGIDVFVTDDIGDGKIDIVTKLLAGIPHAADKAIGSAIKRAAQSGEAYAAKAIRDEYVIRAGDFKNNTQSKRHIITENGGTTVNIDFKGFHIPLMKFDTSFSGGRVSARVKRSNGRTALDHVFYKEVGTHGHAGLFERTTSKRLPIEEKMGPSTPQMMSANDDVSQAIGDKVREVFEERLDHEVTAILNGWRK